jgi:hypothetical protein
MWLVESDQLKKSNDIRNQTHDLPACNINLCLYKSWILTKMKLIWQILVLDYHTKFDPNLSSGFDTCEWTSEQIIRNSFPLFYALFVSHLLAE